MTKSRSTILLIELSIYSLLFFSSFLLPFYNFYYEADNAEGIRTVPQYAFQSSFGIFFVLTFLMVIFSALSRSKGLVHTANVLAILFTLFLGFILFMGFAWWGASPFHPTFEYGYFLSQLLILIVVIRSYTLLPGYKSYSLNRHLTRLSKATAILIPTSGLMYVGYLFYLSTLEPVYVMGSSSPNAQGITVYSEMLDYPAYDAEVMKYYGDDVLDSVHFAYFDNKKIIKEFTVKVKNGKLDVDKVLEENEP